MDNKIFKWNKKQISISLILSAVLLHILSMYFVGNLQNAAYSGCSELIYMIIKFILRWSYLLVPVCFMRIEHMTLNDIGLTKNRLFIQVINGLLIGCVEAFVIVGVTVLLGFKEQLGQPLYENGWIYAIYFFYTIFAVGLFEEIFFRGYIYKKLLDIREEKWFAIIISSLIFGVCHLVGGSSLLQNVPQVLVATMVGIFYCVLREKIRDFSLVSLIFMHGMYDFLIAFLVFVL